MSPLQRLYKTKFALLAVTNVFLGVLLMFLAHWASTKGPGTWLRSWPISDVALGLFTTGLFGVLFQYVGQRDAEAENIRRIREVIVEDFASKPDGLVAMVSPEARDQIIGNSLGVQLGDRAFAEEIYTDLREQLMQADERRHDTEVSVALAPWQSGPATGPGSMFVATIRWEYRLTPTRPVMRFACVSDLDEYRELLRDPSHEVIHYFEPVGKLTGASAEAFDLIEFTVNGRPRSARRAVRAGTQLYTATLRNEDLEGHEQVAVSFAYRVLIQRHGHLLHLYVSKLTKGLKVRFAYGNCGIRFVNVLDYVASANQARVSQLPASGPTPSVEVGFDGWVLPKAGAAFVWVLDDEL